MYLTKGRETQMSRRLLTTISICFVLAGFAAQTQAQQVYRGSYQSVRQLMLRLENRSGSFVNAVQASPAYTTNDKYRKHDHLSAPARAFHCSRRRLPNNFRRSP